MHNLPQHRSYSEILFGPWKSHPLFKLFKEQPNLENHRVEELSARGIQIGIYAATFHKVSKLIVPLLVQANPTTSSTQILMYRLLVAVPYTSLCLGYFVKNELNSDANKMAFGVMTVHSVALAYLGLPMIGLGAFFAFTVTPVLLHLIAGRKDTLASLFDLKDGEGNTVFHLAVKEKKSKSLEHIMDILKDQKELKIKLLNQSNQEGYTPLHLAKTVEALELLAKDHLNLNILGGKPVAQTPLTLFAQNQELPLVERIIALGANVNAQNQAGETALHIAIKKNSWGMVEKLLGQGADAKLKTNEGKSPLELAIPLSLHIAEMLVEKGAKWDPALEKLFTDLLTKKELKKAEFCLKIGCKPSDPALKKIVENSSQEIIQFLLPHFPQIAASKKDTKVEKPKEVVVPVKKKDPVESEKKAYQENLDLLETAIVSGDLKQVEFLLGCGILLSDVLIENNSAARHAILVNNMDLLEVFLKQSLNLETVDDIERTPLLLAVEKGMTKAAEMLLKSKANSKAEDKSGNSILHYAMTHTENTELLNVVLKYNTDVNKQNHKKEGPLDLLLDLNQVECPLFPILVEKGAKLNLALKTGKKALEDALVLGLSDRVDELIALGVDPNKLGADNNTSLFHYVVAYAKPMMAPLIQKDPALLSKLDANGNTPLHIAVEKGDEEAIQFLLFNAADIEAKNRQELTPLGVAVTKKDLKTCKFLVDKKANIQVRDSDQNTLMHLILSHKFTTEPFYKFFDYFKEKAPDLLQAVNKQEETPLHIAAKTANKDLNYDKLLTECKDQVEKQDKDGNTPLLVAFAHGNKRMVNKLMDKGANLKAINKKGENYIHQIVRSRSPEFIKDIGSYLRRGVSIDEPDSGGNTPLHLAVISGAGADIVGILLENEANVSPVNNEGNTPLHLAALRSYQDLFGEDDLVKKLLNNGAAESKNKPNEEGYTPLHFAAKAGHLANVEKLLEAGAESIATKEGMTALSLAVENGHIHLLYRLLKKDGFVYKLLEELDTIKPGEVIVQHMFKKITYKDPAGGACWMDLLNNLMAKKDKTILDFMKGNEAMLEVPFLFHDVPFALRLFDLMGDELFQKNIEYLETNYPKEMVQWLNVERQMHNQGIMIDPQFYKGNIEGEVLDKQDPFEKGVELFLSEFRNRVADRIVATQKDKFGRELNVNWADLNYHVKKLLTGKGVLNIKPEDQRFLVDITKPVIENAFDKYCSISSIFEEMEFGINGRRNKDGDFIMKPAFDAGKVLEWFMHNCGDPDLNKKREKANELVAALNKKRSEKDKISDEDREKAVKDSERLAKELELAEDFLSKETCYEEAVALAEKAMQNILDKFHFADNKWHLDEIKKMLLHPKMKVFKKKKG